MIEIEEKDDKLTQNRAHPSSVGELSDLSRLDIMCLTVRAVHIEVVPTLTTDSMIMAGRS